MSVTTDFDFADRVRAINASAIRQALKNAGPTTISFAGGLPDPALFDVEGLAHASRLALDDRLAFQYSQTEGVPRLREQLAALLAQRGARVDTDGLIVTTGAMQGIHLIAQILLNPGDSVAVERPTFLTALQTFNLHEARVLEVSGDRFGMLPEALESVLRKQRVKLVYVVPNFNRRGDAVRAPPAAA
jgi:DNA-binding transcriptional MocR family regulator